MSESTAPVPRPTSRLLPIFTAAMMALALGAIWAMLALLLHHGRHALAIAVGLGIAQTLRTQGIARTPLATGLAIALTVLASTYAQALLAIGDLAQIIGLSFKEAFVRFDPGFALLLARGRLDGATVLWTAIAMLLAGYWAWRQ